MRMMKLKRIEKIDNDSNRYDIEVRQNHNFFANNILVHNSCSVYTYSPHADDRAFKKHWFVTSKGQGSKGLALYDNEKNNTSNVYVRVAVENNFFDKFEKAAKEMGFDGQFTVFGESAGAGVQDLVYGSKNGKKFFRGFDVFVGEPVGGRYLNVAERTMFFEIAEVPMVPVLYHGPFSYEVMMEHTDGKETVSGKEEHIREGIVVRVNTERFHDKIGRVMLKSVSSDYLFRKNATEYT